MDEDIKKIQLATGCSKEIATKSYLESNKNIKDAIERAKQKYYVGNGQQLQNKVVQIYRYTNGLFVNGNFYSFSESTGKRLKDMIDRGEFDRSILNITGDYVDVELIDVPNEYREPDNKNLEEKYVLKSNFVVAKHDNCPDTIYVDEEGIILGIRVNGFRKKVIIKSGSKLERVRKALIEHTGFKYHIYDLDKLLGDDEIVDNYDGCMLTYRK